MPHPIFGVDAFTDVGRLYVRLDGDRVRIAGQAVTTYRAELLA